MAKSLLEMIQLKRAYDPVEEEDGLRILVDRIWPRGVSKEKAKLDRWMKEIAPSTELRKWFGHDPDKWPEFKRRYEEELKGRKGELAEIAALAERGTVTLVFAAQDREHNDAVALKEILES